MATPSAPTGLTTTSFRNKIEVRWIKNPETNITGYNIYNSTTSGGGVSGYVKLNNVLIEEASDATKEVVDTQTEVEEVGGVRTTTTVETLTETLIYLYSHEDLTEEKAQYYVVTAVNDLGEESPFSVEIWDTPLVITTETYEQPLRTQQEVSLDYISTLLSRTPKLDVKPGSLTRQLHIDPNSREFSLAYIRIDFASRAQSLLTLRELDDEDGDRVSDPVADSSYKQLLKEAYFFETDEEVQDLIDAAFDERAANNGTFRGEAEKSSVDVTFYTTTAPTVSLTVNSGEEISTIPTETEEAINFVTLTSGTLDVDNLDNFYNPITQRYELSLPAEAVIAGDSGNVNADTITNTEVSGMQVTNPLAAFGGSDEESNSDLADRAQLAFVGLDVGTINGYRKTVIAVPGIRDVEIIYAGHPLMQRDYDEVRKKHIFGKVDIYIRGGDPVQFQDNVGFLYNQNIDDEFQVIDATNFIVQTNNSNVSSTYPIFSVTELRNVTEGENYDLLGNWTIYNNTVEMTKDIEVNVNLETGLISFVDPLTSGDVVTADYDYKVLVTGETVIDPALGGEVNFTLDNFPVAKNSYTIYKNNVPLTETTDYTLTLLNGFLQLTQGLDPGDVLTATYKYIVNITNETVISSAVGGEIEANLANDDLLESLLIESDGVTLDLEPTNVINASIGMNASDTIIGTYRYRDSDPIILLEQPPESITSIVGSISGTLTEGTHYTFDNIDDILLEGNSIRAERSVQINYSGGIPAGDVAEATEEIVLVNNEFIELGQKGIDTESIIVKSGATVYVRNTDYLVRDEGDGLNVSIARSVTSSIPNGSTVTVIYDYGELLTITYNVNPLISQVQDEVEVVRHVTADVLVKEVLETSIDFEFSVVLETGTDEVVAASNIRTAISDEINKLSLGQGVAQSDIIAVIEGVQDVVSVLVPLTKMVKADGTQVNREEITLPFIPYQSNVVQSYTTGINALLHNTLGSNAGDGFYAIFEDDISLTLINNANNVDNAAGQGFISSDGEVIISTVDSDDPANHTYTVSYIVNGETGAKDIPITDLEYLSVGEIVITTTTQA